MRQLKVWIGALIFMCALFVITPVAHAEDAPENEVVWEEDGWYYYENGQKVTSSWKHITTYDEWQETYVTYWYYFGANGAAYEGLQTVDGVDYYFQYGGRLHTGYPTVEYDDVYIFNVTETGVVTSKEKLRYQDWTYFDGEWYWFDEQYEPADGLRTINGVDYYFQYGGRLYTGYPTVEYDDVYIFNVTETGVVTSKEKLRYQDWTYFDGEWYWFDKQYEPADGLRTINGRTYYFGWNGEMASDKIIHLEEGTRAFNENGYMVENAWYLSMDMDTKCWYYFGENGVAGEGWFPYNGSWYYLENGRTKIGDYIMEYNGEDHRYTFDTDGRLLEDIVLRKGWFSVDGIWYYYDGEELFKDRWATIDGYSYHFDWNGWLDESSLIWDEQIEGGYVVDASGHWVKNQWVKLVYYYGEEVSFWVYADESGKAVTSDWKHLNGVWYYFDEGGLMVTQNKMIEGKIQLFSASGAWLGTSAVSTGWVQGDGSWYYLENGQFVTGWKAINGAWYYFDLEDYLAYNDGCYDIKEKRYLFDQNAALGNGWVHTSYNRWYLCDDAGVLLTGWQQVHGVWYYLESNMYQDGIFWIDGQQEIFSASGAWCGTVNNMEDGWHLLLGKWYCFEAGEPVCGWVKSNGELYYCAQEMVTNDMVLVNWYDYERLGCKDYYCGFESNGVLARNKWLYLDDIKRWVWCDKEGMFSLNGVL